MPESAPEQARIVGTSAGNETVHAPEGHSSVSGEGGGDVLVGSSGDNRHWITHPKDRVIEQPGGGIDTTIGWTSIKLAPNVENLTVHGDFNYAAGNELGNLIIVDGRQWVYGAGGDDVMVGAAQNQTTFVVRAGEGSDVIYNWNGASQLQLLNYGFMTAADIRAAMTQQGSDVVLRLSSTETLTFRDVSLANFHDRQFLLPLDRSRLGEITFGDEFNTLNIYDHSLQTGQWRADFGGNLKDVWAYSIVSNGERQAYTKEGFQGRGDADLGFNPFSIENGILTITAEPIPAEKQYAAFGREFSSGMLNTFGIFEQKYGYFEIRAEVPVAQGPWPAFWMIPYPYQPAVENDIMESLGATPHVDYRRAYGGSETVYDNAFKIDPAGFHTYGMMWTPTTVTFYYDGVAVLQAPTPANWTEPMAFIVNMAVGGWGGETNLADFPAEMRIDYIRAYALKDVAPVIERGEPEPPAATIRADGGLTSGKTHTPVTFDDTGQPVTSATISVHAAKPGTPPPGKSFVIWEEGGAVFGAVSDGQALGKPTPLMAGSINQVTGTGTWLTDGKVVIGYLQPDGSGGQAAWCLVYDPTDDTFVRQKLGAATGDLDFVALDNGAFAVSWDAPGGKVMARGYDAFAYDGTGWYGPTRELAGDLTGVTATGELIATTSSGAQQLYDIINPPPRVNASVSIVSGPTPVTHAEGNSGLTAFTFTINRDHDHSQKSTVAWSISGWTGNAADGQDFEGGVLPSGVVTFNINETSKTITVYVQGDSFQEPDEEFRVMLSNPVGAQLGNAFAYGKITNDDTGGQPPPQQTQITLATPSLTLNEGSSGTTAFNYTVNRTGPNGGTSTVNWSVAGSGSNPANGADFQGGVLPSGTITFAPNEISKVITIHVVGDGTSEPDEAFTLTLSGASGATLGAATASGNIVNDDGGTQPPPTTPQIAFSNTSVTQAEGNSGSTAFTYTLTRTGSTSGSSTVNWSVTGSGSNPVSGADFPGGALPSGTITFPAGATTISFTINVSGDTTVEPDETFTVTLSNPTGATLGTATATGTVTNDDGSTPPPGDEGQVINSPGPGSTLTGGNGNDTLNASQGSDVLTGGGGADVFAWAREPWSPATVMDFAVGTDKLNLSALFQAAGYTGSDPIADGRIVLMSQNDDTLVLFDDDGAGGAWPNYIIKLEGVATSGLTWAQLSGGGGSPPPPSAQLGFTNPTLSLAEGNSGATAFTFTVARTGSTSGTSTVNWTVTGSGSNAASGADFQGGTLPSGTITFAAGETSKTVTVNVAGDTTVEPNETFTVTLSGATGATLGTATATGTITNDDGSTPPPTGEGQVINSPGPGSTLTGGNGNDTLNASQGPDVLTGGGGADVFAWAREPWSPATVMDFTVGTDKLNLSALFQAAGYTGSDPIADGRIVLMSQDNDTLVLFDDDGAGGAWPNYIIKLEGVAAGGLTWAQLSGGGGGTQPPPPPPPTGEGKVINSPGPGSTLTGGSGNDTLNASQGSDTLTGNGGADRFVFANENWSPAVITDFAAGSDKIDISGVFDDWGYTGTNPFADGRVLLVSDGSGGTKVLLDDDGPGGAWGNYVLHVQGVAPETLRASENWIFQ